jgi:pyruvate/2-oxoglutarate/acetoin dehydrogenase E1 component
VTGAEMLTRAIAESHATTVADAAPADVVVPLVADGGIAIAAGIALSGKATAVRVSSAARLVAGLDALRHAANAGFDCPLLVIVPVGGQAGPHVDAPILGLLDGIEVWTGSSGDDLADAARGALRGTRPVVLLEPRTVAFDRMASPTASEGPVTVVAWGDGVAAAGDEGVLPIRRLIPLDPAVGAAVRKTGRVVLVHNGETTWADRAMASVLAEAFEYLESPPVAVPADADAIAAAIQESIQF